MAGQGTGGAGAVRVRVRPGARLKMSQEHTAVGGNWVELHASDLAIASIRSHVDTEEEIAQREAEASRVAEAPSDSPAADHFGRLRASARAQAEQTVENRAAVERELAARTLNEAKSDDAEQAQPEPQQGKKKAR